MDKARATPALAGDKLFIGTKGGRIAGGGQGAKMLAFNKNTGALLWVTRAGPGAGGLTSGGSCLSGAAISRGELFWGSGYGNLFGTFGSPNNKLYAFALPK